LGRWVEVHALDDLRRIPKAEVLHQVPLVVTVEGIDLRAKPVKATASVISGPTIAWVRGVALQAADPRCPDRSINDTADQRAAINPGQRHVMRELASALGVTPPEPPNAVPYIAIELALEAAQVKPKARVLASTLVNDRLAAGGQLQVTTELRGPGPGAWTLNWFVGHEPLTTTSLRLPPRLPDGVRYSTDGPKAAQLRLAPR
jgi:hypothetical protein